MGLFSSGLDKVETDPCISEIVKFFTAVKGITEKSEFIMSWVDIYDDRTLICRYFDNDRPSACYYGEQIEVYGRDDEAHNRLMFESINGKNMPKGTQISFQDNYSTLQLFLTLTPQYPKLRKKYGKVIAQACQEHGIDLDSWSEDRVRIKLAGSML